MRQIRAYGRRQDDGDRGADAKLHACRLGNAEHLKDFVEHRHDDRTAADTEGARENPGDDAAEDDGQRKPGDLAQRNAEKHDAFDLELSVSGGDVRQFAGRCPGRRRRPVQAPLRGIRPPHEAPPRRRQDAGGMHARRGSLYLKPGSVYNVTSTEQSQAHLLGLKIYRLVNINYNDSKEDDSLQEMAMKIDCNIQLTLLSLQSYKIELEGTNSAGNLGGAVNLIYQHKNLFHGAELFSTKLKGAYSAYSQNQKLSSIEEYGVETSLRLPEFVAPFFRLESFVKKYNPSTTIIASWDYQKLPVYIRTIANASFGYDWKSGNYREHILTPIQFNIVKLPFIDPTFATTILASSYQSSSYKDVLILGGNYSYIFSNQSIKNSKDYWFLRFNTEIAGNFLSAIYNISGAKKSTPVSGDTTFAGDTTRAFYLLGQPFAQYVKADIDIRYNYKFNDVSSIVYRGFFGIGVPYGNSKAVPFERQYFAGGANDIRAWQVRTLGPELMLTRPAF